MSNIRVDGGTTTNALRARSFEKEVTELRQRLTQVNETCCQIRNATISEMRSQGWLSPDEAAKLQAQCAAMREAFEWIEGYFRTNSAWLFSHSDTPTLTAEELRK